MTDKTAVAPLRRHRRALRGGPPITISGGGGSPSRYPRYPVRGKLSPVAGDVLALLVRPRSMLEVADALGIESPMARHHLDHLVLRGLVEEVGKYPTTWGVL